MASRTLLKRLAAGLVCVLLFAQMAVAAHACAKSSPGVPLQTAAAEAIGSAPDCHPQGGTSDPTLDSLCAEHCKQGNQSDRASFGVTVPPALLNPLYRTPAVPEPSAAPPRAGAWLSALVAASPPHALAHCVLRI
jgi:hypothetical protein